MSWIVFSYSLPAQKRSSGRVALWRRLQRLGAISHKSGVYLLPDREECMESFQWLAQEVQQAKGSATLMRVEKFEGLEDRELIEIFRKVREEDYEAMNAQIDSLEKTFRQKELSSKPDQIRSRIEKLRSQFSDIERIDFFHSPSKKVIQERLNKIQQRFITPKTNAAGLPSFSIAEYENKRWVTRPKPHVDRLGCAWFIRKFVDKNAKIHYSNAPEPNETPFDTKGALFGHYQNFCSFETMMAIFGIKDTALQAVAEIIHEIDLRDGRYFRPETEGVAVILKGWLQAGFSDEELESHGLALFEGLYTAFNRNAGPTASKKSKKSSS